MRLVVRRRDGYTCRMCGSYGREVDHIIPVSEGGQYVLSNLQVLCVGHHREKTLRERRAK